MSIFTIVIGLFIIAWGWTTQFGHPINTIALLSGTFVSIIGIVLLIRSILD